ncbi:MAG: metallophosphoesterase family protein [Mycoplasma sp.]
MVKVLVVSDTHCNDTWLKIVNSNKYDYIIHAGDHQMSSKQISDITEYYVDGNNDWGDKKIIFFEICGYKFMLTHGDKYLFASYEYPTWEEKMLQIAKEKSVNFVIFGHTHIPIIKTVSNIVFMNPGSMSISRHNGKKCYSEIIFDDDQNFEIFEYII